MKQDMENLLYRVYVTDMLKGFAGGSERYYDLINPKPAVGETRTAEEIIAEISTLFNGNGGEAE